MSLEEKARQVIDKGNEIIEITRKLVRFAGLALLRIEFDSTIIELEQTKKQKLIQHYQTLKAELEALVEALP